MMLINQVCNVIIQRVKDLVARRSVNADRIHRNAVSFFIDHGNFDTSSGRYVSQVYPL